MSASFCGRSEANFIKEVLTVVSWVRGVLDKGIGYFSITQQGLAPHHHEKAAVD